MVLSDDDVSIFHDGTTGDPQLDHPEGVAVDRDGNVWCGGERGQIYRLDPQGERLEEVASTGGFCLGMAFDRYGDLFVCDMKHAAVFRLEAATGRVERFCDGAPGSTVRRSRTSRRSTATAGSTSRTATPSGCRDRASSASSQTASPSCGGPRTSTSRTGWRCRRTDGWLYVVETFASRVCRIPDRRRRVRRRAGGRRRRSTTPTRTASRSTSTGTCTSGATSRARSSGCRRRARSGSCTATISAHTLAHPTNVAFRGSTLFSANLGRWHLTRLEVGAQGAPLPNGAL